MGSPARAEEWTRRAFWILLIASWVVAVWYMWDAMTTIPSAERLQESRMAEIPGPRRFFAAMAFSGMELAVVLAALWPWRPAYYASRLAVTALGVLTWFIMTTPMDLSRMDWVHRRWLAFLALAQVAALVTVLVYRGIRAVIRGRPL
ncbi:MAG: hypothetical protein R3314_06180 [Longimicrobiales bacterium]|nr:hypothetical protein [Longimicrobiales bacterium]